MVFPSTLGVSGDVHVNVGYKFDNAAGSLVKPDLARAPSASSEQDLAQYSYGSNATSAANLGLKASKRLHQLSAIREAPQAESEHEAR